jgi:Histidine kinase-, DNA gyrase B-, and HSP90-like ATPase/His Kinase A (phospho-acceptor) domain
MTRGLRDRLALAPRGAGSGRSGWGGPARLVALLALAGLAVAGTAGMEPIAAADAPPWWPAAIAFGLADLWSVKLPLGLELVAPSVLLVVGLTLLAPAGLIAARVSGLGMAWLARDPTERSGLLESVLVWSLATTAAVLATRASLAAARGVGVPAIESSLIGAAIATTVALSVVGATSFGFGARRRRPLADALTAGAVGIALGSILGTALVVQIQRDRIDLDLLVVAIIAIGVVLKASQMEIRARGRGSALAEADGLLRAGVSPERIVDVLSVARSVVGGSVLALELEVAGRTFRAAVGPGPSVSPLTLVPMADSVLDGAGAATDSMSDEPIGVEPHERPHPPADPGEGEDVTGPPLAFLLPDHGGLAGALELQVDPDAGPSSAGDREFLEGIAGLLGRRIAEDGFVEHLAEGIHGLPPPGPDQAGLGAPYLEVIAHELRAPLHAIVVAADVLGRPTGPGAVESRNRRLAAAIQSGGQHMIRLLDDLVDLAAIEAGHLALARVAVDLEGLVNETIEQTEPLLAERAMDVLTTVAAVPHVPADPLRIRQVLLNLLVNATKFGSAGSSVEIEIRRAGSGVEIAVRDRGPGIHPDDLERIFEPFEQASDVTRDGIGLGLAISRRIVALHGGTLRATSELGRGSTFILSLPLPPDRED